MLSLNATMSKAHILNSLRLSSYSYNKPWVGETLRNTQSFHNRFPWELLEAACFPRAVSCIFNLDRFLLHLCWIVRKGVRLRAPGEVTPTVRIKESLAASAHSQGFIGRVCPFGHINGRTPPDSSCTSLPPPLHTMQTSPDVFMSSTWIWKSEEGGDSLWQIPLQKNVKNI